MRMITKLLNTGLFFENEFFYKYVDVINSNHDTIKEQCRTQTHHIVPKYYFEDSGLEIDNSSGNLVELLYKDHIIAHYYLALCSIKSENRARNVLAIKFLLQGSTLEALNIDDIDLDVYQSLYEMGRKYTYEQSHTIEVNRKVSNTLKGRTSPNKGNKYAEKKSKANPNAKNKKLSAIASMRTGEDNPFYGKKHSQTTKDLISKKNSKAVAMIDLSTGDIIKTFSSIKLAADYLKESGIADSISVPNRISRVCRSDNRSFKAYGYNWAFVEEGVTTIESTTNDISLW